MDSDTRCKPVTTRELLSPRQVALAIGVSESSLKRWCDQGALPTVRTLGGHRRVPLAAVLQFVKESGRTLANPELLGLPGMTGHSEWTLARAADHLVTALVDAQEEVCRRILFDLFLAGHSLSAIGDEIIRPAFAQIGELWDCGQAAVYQERRACEITERILHELRGKLQDIVSDAPLALGGTLSGDNYRLPTLLVELTLRERGWRAESLGTGLPWSTLNAAIEDRRPQLFWLSVSTLSDEPTFRSEYSQLEKTAERCGTVLVLGGNSTPDFISAADRSANPYRTLLPLTTVLPSQIRS